MNPMTPSTEQMQKATSTVMTVCEELGAIAREQFDATIKSATVISKGWEELARSTSGIMQESVARAMSSSKTMLAARSLREVTDMHSELVKDMFDSWVASTGKISEISARVTQDAVAPITEHTNKAFSKIAQKVKSAA